MTATSAPRRNRAGLVMVIIGGAILLLSIIAGVVVAVLGFAGVAGGASQNQVLPDGTGVVSIEEGEQRTVYIEQGAPPPSCIIYGPDGSDPVDGTRQTSSLTHDGTSWESSFSIQATASGPHTVECLESPIMVGPPVSIGGIFAGVGGILVVILGGGLGLVIGGAGLVIHLMTRPKG